MLNANWNRNAFRGSAGPWRWPRRSIDPSLPLEETQRLENILVSHVDISGRFATTFSIFSNGYLRDASPADKNVRRVNTMARSKAVLGFSGIVIAFWELSLPIFALPRGNPRSNMSEGQISPLNAQIKDKSR